MTHAAVVLVRDAEDGTWLSFTRPRAVLTAHTPGEVLPALAELDKWLGDNDHWAAGFLSYEAAPAFDRVLRTHPLSGFPLLWFGLYGAPQRVPAPPPPWRAVAACTWTPNVSRATYDAAIARVRDHIARGDTYQVNYTIRLRAPLTASPWDLFLQLVHAQPHSYAAYLDLGEHVIASASPELFFSRRGAQLTMRPMKGTAPRGRFPAEDRARAAWLEASEKNRAENIMITDMVRNDLGRIAQTGSVRVARLCATERYPTVWQMTSTVCAESDASPVELFTALFPCASITGAPKPRTMQIIAALEPEPRRVYTGTLGFFAPGRRAQFNVAIRTLLADRANRTAEYGVGGGIVWDSEAGDEYAETQDKARVLTDAPRHFDLLESLRWTPAEGFWLLAEHLARLAASADYFDYPYDAAQVRAALERAVSTLPPHPHKVRLLLARDGGLRTTAAPLEAESKPVPLALAHAPVDSQDRFLFHKTTRRGVYDAALAARGAGHDVILYNERGELTETCNSNLVLELEGEAFTPPIECGLLAGAYRASLLATGRVRERVLAVSDLARADGVFVINSVRGRRPAVLLDPVPGPVRAPVLTGRSARHPML